MRLIDADELIEQMEADAEHIDDAICKMMHYALTRDINNQPTVDPVKHGRWIEHHYAGGMYFTCSICNHDGAGRFCSNCGARMDEEDA